MPKFQKSIKLIGYSEREIFDKVRVGLEALLNDKMFANSSFGKNEKDHSFSMGSKLFSAELKCLPQEIKIDIDLSFLASPFRGQIEEKIGKWVNRYFSQNP